MTRAWQAMALVLLPPTVGQVPLRCALVEI